MNVCCLFRVTEDILYFKKIELRTKMGRRGRILEPLGKSTSECRLACRWFTTGRFGPEAQPAADSSTVGNPGCFTGYPGCRATRMTPQGYQCLLWRSQCVYQTPVSHHITRLCVHMCVFFRYSRPHQVSLQQQSYFPGLVNAPAQICTPACVTGIHGHMKCLLKGSLISQNILMHLSSSSSSVP